MNKKLLLKDVMPMLKKMSSDEYKSNYIISDTKSNNYLNFIGGYPYYAETTGFFYRDQANDCTAYLNAIKKFFKCKTTRQRVCEKQCFSTQYYY